jgi:hypothetical protein
MDKSYKQIQKSYKQMDKSYKQTQNHINRYKII